MMMAVPLDRLVIRERGCAIEYAREHQGRCAVHGLPK
jgi:hypothetical protein